MIYGGIDFITGRFFKATKQEWINRYQDSWEYLANVYLVFCGIMKKLSCPVCKKEFGTPTALRRHFKTDSLHIAEAYFESRVEMKIDKEDEVR